jgi:hypothetical protein
MLKLQSPSEKPELVLGNGGKGGNAIFVDGPQRFRNMFKGRFRARSVFLQMHASNGGLYKVAGDIARKRWPPTIPLPCVSCGQLAGRRKTLTAEHSK